MDAFITGEISEPSAHLARESGVAFVSAGHHATERYGVQAVGNFSPGSLTFSTNLSTLKIRPKHVGPQRA